MSLDKMREKYGSEKVNEMPILALAILLSIIAYFGQNAVITKLCNSNSSYVNHADCEDVKK